MRSDRRSEPTDLLHAGRRRGQEALQQQLLPRLLVVHLDLRHHVAGDVAQASAALPPVEPVRVFVPVDLAEESRGVTRIRLTESLQEYEWNRIEWNGMTLLIPHWGNLQNYRSKKCKEKDRINE